MLFQFEFGMTFKQRTKNTIIININYRMRPTDPRSASTVTVQANNLSHSMKIAKGVDNEEPNGIND